MPSETEQTAVHSLRDAVLAVAGGLGDLLRHRVVVASIMVLAGALTAVDLQLVPEGWTDDVVLDQYATVFIHALAAGFICWFAGTATWLAARVDGRGNANVSVLRDCTTFAGVGGAVRGQPFSDARRWRNAVHEAGHLLACAPFLEEVSDIEVHVGRTAEGQTGGFVRITGDVSVDRRDELANFRRMLVAGGMAETLILGEAGSGMVQDLSRWEDFARKSLTCFGTVDQPWFIEPRNDAETRANVAALAALREKDDTAAREYLEENKALLVEIAETLRDKCEMRDRDIRDALSRVALPSIPGEEMK